MTSKNDVTKDKQQTKPATDAYRDNYDNIFRKCEHNWEYQASAHFDWYQCTKCGIIKDREYVP